MTIDPHNISVFSYQPSDITTVAVFAQAANMVNNNNMTTEKIFVIQNNMSTAGILMHQLNVFKKDLYSDLFDRQFELKNQTSTNQRINKIIFIGNEIWASATHGIQVYSQDLEFLKIRRPKSSYTSITLTHTGDVIAAKYNESLHLFDNKGNF